MLSPSSTLLAAVGLFVAQVFGAVDGKISQTTQCALALPITPISTCRRTAVGWWYDPQVQGCAISESCQLPPFVSRNECLAACRPDPCLANPATGPCRARRIGYYFQRGRCRPFVWGGCRGNIPFTSLPECQHSCENRPRANFLGFDQRCSLQSERSTRCDTEKMYIQAFFYNPHHQTCEKGIWKACSDSEPFFSLRECNNVCTPRLQ